MRFRPTAYSRNATAITQSLFKRVRCWGENKQIAIRDDFNNRPSFDKLLFLNILFSFILVTDSPLFGRLLCAKRNMATKLLPRHLHTHLTFYITVLTKRRRNLSTELGF